MLNYIPSHKIDERNLLQAVQLLCSAFTEEHRQVQEEITVLKKRDHKIYEIMEHLRRDTNQGFSETHECIAETNERLGSLENSVNQRFDETNVKMDQTNERLDETNVRLGSLEGEVKGLRGEVKGLRSDMNSALGEQTEILRMIAKNLSKS